MLDLTPWRIACAMRCWIRDPARPKRAAVLMRVITSCRWDRALDPNHLTYPFGKLGEIYLVKRRAQNIDMDTRLCDDVGG